MIFSLGQVFAIVEFAEEKNAEHVLHMREPLLIYGKRLTVKPRDVKVHRKPEVHRDGDETVQADQDQHNRRGRRFRGHHDRGYFEEQRFKFDPEVQRQLSSVNSVSQINTMCSTIICIVCVPL